MRTATTTNLADIAPLDPSTPILGILAGGRASRLGGRDKAWLMRDGMPQVSRIAAQFRPQCADVVVSANRDPERYAAHDLRTVSDRHAGIGPVAGLDALASGCAAPWLFTVPVDLVALPHGLLPLLQAAGPAGAYAEDDDGVQPLVALWPVARLRAAVEFALAADDRSVQALQARMRMARVRMPGVRLGNLNTRADLEAAGIPSIEDDTA